MVLDIDGVPIADWYEAMSFTASLGTLFEVQDAEWRLPTSDEFRLLISRDSGLGIKLPIMISPWTTLDKNGQFNRYWTSSYIASDELLARYIELSHGIVYAGKKSDNYHLLPVHSGQLDDTQLQTSASSISRFIDLGNRTVHDKTTKLTILRELDDIRKIVEYRNLGISDKEIRTLLVTESAVKTRQLRI